MGTPCGFTILDHPHKLIEDGTCDPNTILLQSGVTDLKQVSCADCATLKYPAGQEQLFTEVWGDLQARCAANCIIPGSAEIGAVEQQVAVKNRNIAAVAIIVVVFLIIAALIYTF